MALSTARLPMSNALPSSLTRGPFNPHAPRVRWSANAAGKNFPGGVHQHAFRLGAPAIKSQNKAHASRIRDKLFAVLQTPVYSFESSPADPAGAGGDNFMLG